MCVKLYVYISQSWLLYSLCLPYKFCLHFYRLITYPPIFLLSPPICITISHFNCSDILNGFVCFILALTIILIIGIMIIPCIKLLIVFQNKIFFPFSIICYMIFSLLYLVWPHVKPVPQPFWYPYWLSFAFLSPADSFSCQELNIILRCFHDLTTSCYSVIASTDVSSRHFKWPSFLKWSTLPLDSF